VGTPSYPKTGRLLRRRPVFVFLVSGLPRERGQVGL